MPCAEHRPLEVGEITASPAPEQRFSPLRNKLFIPSLRPERVSRPRLVKLLQSGLNKALILVSAPAGYGKTTLVSSWLQEAGVPFAWISLDEGDDDPTRFLQYLIAAAQTVLPPARYDLSGLLQRTHSDGYRPLLNLLIDEIDGNAGPFVLVLDDFHTLQSQPVLDILAYLLERLPRQMHLALLTRTDPPLPLARLRGRGQLVEIRAEHLSFTTAEAAEFLQQVMGLKLSGEDIAALEERTEGWIAGLQLAALAVQDRQDLHASVSAFTGSHFYIIDYLTEEALNRLPDQLRSFLLQTSILSSLCGPLGEAVAGLDPNAAGTGQTLIETLDRMNLFIIPLDEKRCWYRYHHLFAEVLRMRLEHQFPHQVTELHRRASTWYERSGYPSEAINHALKAGDQARAAELIEGNGCSLILSGESYTLLKWVAAVDAYSHTRAWLAILKAWALALTGNPQPVEALLQSAEKMIASAELTHEVRIVLGSIATIRAYLANQQAQPGPAESYARSALEYLPEGDSFACSLRGIATAIYGDVSWLNGNLENARTVYTEAVQISRASSNVYTTLIAQSDLADVLAAQGQLHQAAGIYREILQAGVRPNGQNIPLTDRVLAGLAKILYEWNQVEAAADLVHQQIELCRQWGNPYLLADGCLLQARLDLARGNPQAALEHLLAAERSAADPHLSVSQAQHLRTALAREWIACGNLGRAGQLLEPAPPPAGGRPSSPPAGDPQLPGDWVRLRLLLARGDHASALALSSRWLQQAQAENRLGRVIEVLILRALAFQGQKDTPQALDSLAQALELARPEGFTRLFLDEGERLARLIFQVSLRGLDHGYAAALLPALGVDLASAPRPAQTLIEPLTVREIEVLKLIAAGCANHEIAAKLVISIPTVKRHISNLYTKLGAKNRTQAVSFGRETGLLDQ